MKTLKKIILLIILSCLIPFWSFGQKRDITKDPKYLKIIDLAQCNLIITEIETVKGIILNDGKKLTASRKNARLVLVKLEGVAYDFGRISYNPSLFGVNYIYKGSLTYSPAKAIGWRGITINEKVTDVWDYKVENSFNIVVESAGEKISIWIALELPDSIKSFYLRFPAAMQASIEFPE